LEWPAVEGSRRDTAGTFQRSRCLRLTETAAARDRPVTPRSETEKLPCQLDSESGPNKRVRCIVSRFDRGIGSNQNGAIPDSDSDCDNGATFLYSPVVVKTKMYSSESHPNKVLPDRTEPRRIFSTFSYVVAHSFVKFISESDRWDYFPRLGSASADLRAIPKCGARFPLFSFYLRHRAASMTDRSLLQIQFFPSQHSNRNENVSICHCPATRLHAIELNKIQTVG